MFAWWVVTNTQTHTQWQRAQEWHGGDIYLRIWKNFGYCYVNHPLRARPLGSSFLPFYLENKLIFALLISILLFTSTDNSKNILFGISKRAFVERNYKDLKTLNPKFPILIRECSGIKPQLWARYGIFFSLLFCLNFISCHDNFQIYMSRCL